MDPRSGRPGGAGSWRFGVPALVLGVVGYAAGLYPIQLPQASAAFNAPYEAVWQATVTSLGAAQPVLLDRPSGRIVTGQFTFSLPVGGGGMGFSMNPLLVSMEIHVRRTPEGSTAVEVRSTIYDAQQYGAWPGPGGPNSPEGDLFARIADRLGKR